MDWWEATRDGMQAPAGWCGEGVKQTVSLSYHFLTSVLPGHGDRNLEVNHLAIFLL